MSDGVTSYAVAFTIMISDSDNTSDWHCMLISKFSISVIDEIGIAVIDVIAINILC